VQQPYGEVAYGQVAYGGHPQLYVGPLQPAYVLRVAGAPMYGQPGHGPRGAFSDGLFDCFDAMSICFMSLCCLPIRWAQTVERLRFMSFTKALVFYGFPWLVMIGMQTAYNLTLHWWFIIPLVVCNLIQIALGTIYRTKIRERYQIPGSECEDCVLHTFCTCCAVAQEARHVDRDYAIPL
jgi:Cys-rich protein (TIGR01571 family)